MPHGQKRKPGARNKNQNAHGKIQNTIDAAAKAAEGDQPSTTPVVSKSICSTCSGDVCQCHDKANGDGFSDKGASNSQALVHSPKKKEESPSTTQAELSESPPKESLTRKMSMVVQYVLEMFAKKEPITQTAMLKIVTKKYKDMFPEILRRASERIELVFGLELKETKPEDQYYTLDRKLGFHKELSGFRFLDEGFPKMGLLMTILGVIFMKGNRATEEEIWDFLGVLQIYAGRRHVIFGEPRKLIIEDFVQKKYLEYHLVPHSDPIVYEFSWGPKAHAETTKMKVLEILAKINETTPSSFPDLYEEALKDEDERARAKAMGRAASLAKAAARAKAASMAKAGGKYRMKSKTSFKN
ncbi:melanoma-associated antigen B4-like [Suncus etruscus]|uniref:melanoma-associated antigen B4-like n=1 Tax=Suncus etruscus TaxID=109475 RepID=UPI00210FDADD|nr:melanoma-associated antigen B4-like [Suncus etruscus]